jgi:hypothetical protein
MQKTDDRRLGDRRLGDRRLKVQCQKTETGARMNSGVLAQFSLPIFVTNFRYEDGTNKIHGINTDSRTISQWKP